MEVLREKQPFYPSCPIINAFLRFRTSPVRIFNA
jgi:hypothetical protein